MLGQWLFLDFLCQSLPWEYPWRGLLVQAHLSCIGMVEITGDNECQVMDLAEACNGLSILSVRTLVVIIYSCESKL